MYTECHTQRDLASLLLSLSGAAVQYDVMVTAGANQALTSIMLTLLDPPDRAVLFRPYYFNALMALQMTG